MMSTPNRVRCHKGMISRVQNIAETLKIKSTAPHSLGNAEPQLGIVITGNIEPLMGAGGESRT